MYVDSLRLSPRHEEFRLSLVFIHKCAKPRCFANVNMSALPLLQPEKMPAWIRLIGSVGTLFYSYNDYDI